MTSNAAVDSAEKTGPTKISEKIAEKRRALGRGVEALLPGPRALAPAPAIPQNARKDGAPDTSSSSNSQFPVLSSQSSSPSPDSSISAAPPNPNAAVPGSLDKLQAMASGQTSGQASGQTSDGDTVFRLT